MTLRFLPRLAPARLLPVALVAAGLAAGSGLLAGCDSGETDPPPPPPAACTGTDTNTLDCAIRAGEVRYDTTGTTIAVVDLGNGVAPRVNEVTWSSDYTYLLDGKVFVNNGQTLRIEAGTVIKAEGGTGTAASALVVARGGKIFAEGRADAPIIFTSEADDLSGTLPPQGGLWGGVVILGKARTNTVPGTRAIEGIPTSEPRGAYGCGDAGFACDDADDSGVFRYVSLRYGGAVIGANNELNGLTLGAVGSGTTVEYVEVFANTDDGVEFFGGTVNAKYLAVFVEDDMYDYDEGWRGKGQFFFGLHAATTGNQLGEHDGGTTPEDGTPYATPTIYNATYIGSGAASTNGSSNGLIFGDNAGGRYANSIFTEARNYAVSVEDLASGQDSRARLEAGDLALRNNVFGAFGAGTDPAALFRVAGSGGTDNGWFVAYMTDAAQANVIADPALVGVSRTNNGGLDPRPAAGSAALAMALAAYPAGDAFFTPVTYAGAFGPNAADNWLRGWTALDQLGYLAD